MRGKKVTAIKRAAKKSNDGVNPDKKDMKALKGYNRHTPIPALKTGTLWTIPISIPISKRILQSDVLKHKTMGKLSIQWKR